MEAETRAQVGCPLSFAQERLWFLDQLDPASPLYTIASVLRLEGRLHVAALEQSLQAVIQRHESLRTTFALDHDQPVQRIAAQLQLLVPVIDCSSVSDQAAQEAAAQEAVQEEIQYPFDLAHGPLIRARLFRMGEENHVLLLTLHHSVADDWSIDLLFKELSHCYTAYQVGKPLSLPELTIQYADYAHWQRQWLQGSTLDELRDYWRQHLAGAPPVLELPTDFPRPAEVSHRGAHVTFTLPARLSQDLQALSLREGTTLFMTLLAAFTVLLYRYSGQTDLVVGTPVAGRQQRETENLIGLFVNTLVLRTGLSGNPTLREVLKRVREVCLGAYEHQDLPFEKLVETLQPERHLSASPLFQVLFALEHLPAEPITLPGLTLHPMDRPIRTAKFDLSLLLTETPTTLLGTIEYQTDLFREETIVRLSRHWQHLLAEMVAQPDQHIADLSLLSEEERQQVVVDWNATQTAYPRQACVHELFEAWAASTPDAIALTFEGQQLTYEEVNRRANQVAHALRRLGVGPEVAVGLCLERSLDLVIALLGILKAGGVYVPLDPAYPPDRLAFMLADAQIAVLLTQTSLRAQLPPTSAPVVCLDRDWSPSDQQPTSNPDKQAVAANLAYIMYTSGSTGQPKGVCIPHQAVVRLVKATSYACFTPDQIFLLFAPISFDATTFELWGPLLNGARLVLAPPGTGSLEELGRVLAREQITTLWLTAGLFHLMVDEHLPSLATLQQLLAGGDVLSVSHVRQVLQQPTRPVVINGYGPTENTTFTCCYPMTQPEQVGSTVAIGKPIANTQVYVLDEQGQPVPVGVPGELYIGGVGLARGYLNRPELTAERFVPHPFSPQPGERLYRTGDWVRYRPDGGLEFLGRLDQQIKLRGFRIELGEIEACLKELPLVQEAVVVLRRDHPDNPQLAAYVMPKDASDITADELQRALRKALPAYMIPSAFVLLSALPLNPNGKIDRRALPVPGVQREQTYVAPRNPTEELVAQIWMELLGLPRIGIHEHFFTLGGHSLLVIRVLSRLRETFQVEIPLQRFFERPTIAALCEAIEEIMLAEIMDLSEEEAGRALSKLAGRED
jgi:amino acid adenylation domain-containing protein